MMTSRSSPPQIVLASASRARREVLAAAGVAFTVEPADVDEPAIRRDILARGAKFDAVAIAQVLARAKAEDVSSRHEGALIIGADQVLALGEELLTKPKDLADARTALNRLRGKTHELHSAVAFAMDGAIVWSHVATARLTMRAFSDAFLDDYLVRAGDRITQSVGAYELEGLGVQLFERIEGDYFTILGLPLLPLLNELRERGMIMR
jgi:nucleoside triphosphate pyrophosphatase